MSSGCAGRQPRSPLPSARRRCRQRRHSRRRDRRLPRLPARQPLEPARRPAAGRIRTPTRSFARIGLGDTMHADFGSGLLGGRADRDPVRDGRRRQPRVPRELRLRRRVGPRPLPDPSRASRSRAAASADGDRHVIVVDRARCRLYELFAAYPQAGGARWQRRLGRDLEPALEPAAPARLDLGGRRRPADPARARPLRRGQARPHRPRAPLHGADAPAGLHLPGPPLRLEPDRPGPARDGPAAAAEARLRHLALPAPGAHRPEGAQALRDDPGRQRLVLVRERRAGPAAGDNDDLHSLGGVPGSAFEVLESSLPRR